MLITFFMPGESESGLIYCVYVIVSEVKTPKAGLLFIP